MVTQEGEVIMIEEKLTPTMGLIGILDGFSQDTQDRFWEMGSVTMEQ